MKHIAILTGLLSAFITFALPIEDKCHLVMFGEETASFTAGGTVKLPIAFHCPTEESFQCAGCNDYISLHENMIIINTEAVQQNFEHSVLISARGHDEDSYLFRFFVNPPLLECCLNCTCTQIVTGSAESIVQVLSQLEQGVLIKNDASSITIRQETDIGSQVAVEVCGARYCREIKLQVHAKRQLQSLQSSCVYSNTTQINYKALLTPTTTYFSIPAAFQKPCSCNYQSTIVVDANGQLVGLQNSLTYNLQSGRINLNVTEGQIGDYTGIYIRLSAADCPGYSSTIAVNLEIQCANYDKSITLTPVSVADNFRFIHNEFAFKQFTYSHYQCAKPSISVSVQGGRASNWTCSFIKDLMQCSLPLDRFAQNLIGANTVDVKFTSPKATVISFPVNIVDPCNDNNVTTTYFYWYKVDALFTFGVYPQLIQFQVRDQISDLFLKPQFCGPLFIYKQSEINNIDVSNLVRNVTVYTNYTVNLDMQSNDRKAFNGVTSVTLNFYFGTQKYLNSFFYLPQTIELIDSCQKTTFLSESPDIQQTFIYTRVDSILITLEPIWDYESLQQNQPNYCGTFKTEFSYSSSPIGSVDNLVTKIDRDTFQLARYYPNPNAPVTDKDQIWLIFNASLPYYNIYKAEAKRVVIKVVESCLATQLWPFTRTPNISSSEHATLVGFNLSDLSSLRTKYFGTQTLEDLNIRGPKHNYLWNETQVLADMNLVRTQEVKHTYYYQSDIVSEVLKLQNQTQLCNRPSYELFVEGKAGNNDFIKLTAPEDGSYFTLTLFTRYYYFIGNYSCEVRATIKNGPSSIVSVLKFRANIFANFSTFQQQTEEVSACNTQVNLRPQFLNSTQYMIGANKLYNYYDKRVKKFVKTISFPVASAFQVTLPAIGNWACFQKSFNYKVTFPEPQGSIPTVQIPDYPEITTQRYLAIDCTVNCYQAESILTMWIPPTYQNQTLKVLVQIEWTNDKGIQKDHYVVQIIAGPNRNYPATNDDWKLAYNRFKLAHGDYVAENVQRPSPYVPNIWGSQIQDSSTDLSTLQAIRQAPINLSKANPSINYANLIPGARAKWLLDDGSIVISQACLPVLQEVTSKGKVTISFSRSLKYFDAAQLFNSSAVQVLLVPGDPEADPTSYNYEVFLDSKDSDSFTLGLRFAEPANVGYNTNVPDTLQIAFVGSENFVACSQDKYQSTFRVAPNVNRRLELGAPLNDQTALSQIPQGFTISLTLPPQIDPNSTETQQPDLSNVGTATTSSVFSTLAICFVFNLSMQLLLGSINALQMISHLPMINLNFSPDYLFLNGFIQQVVGFDLFNIFSYFPDVFAFSEVQPWHYWFANNQTAYNDVNFLNNVGSIALFLMIFVLRLLMNPLFGLLQKLGVRGHNCMVSMYVGRLKLINMTLTILSEAFIELLIGGIMNIDMLTQVPLEVRSGMDQWSIDFGFVCLIFAVILPFVVTWYTLVHSRWLTSLHLDEERLAFYKSEQSLPFKDAQKHFEDNNPILQKQREAKQQAIAAEIADKNQELETLETKRKLNADSSVDQSEEQEKQQKSQDRYSNGRNSPNSGGSSNKLQKYFLRKLDINKPVSRKHNENVQLNFVPDIDEEAMQQFFKSRVNKKQLRGRMVKQFGHEVRKTFNLDLDLGWHGYVMECELAEVRLNENVGIKYEVERKRQSYQAWEVLNEGIKPTSHLANLNRFLFIWRRVVFVLMTLFLEEPALQLIIFMSMSFLMIAYLVTVMPYEEDFNNNIEIFNEVVVFLVSLQCLILVAFKHDQTNLGISMISSVMFMLAVNGYFVIKDLLAQIYEKAKQEYIRKKQLRKMRERKITVTKYKANATVDRIDEPQFQDDDTQSRIEHQIEMSALSHAQQQNQDSSYSSDVAHSEQTGSIRLGAATPNSSQPESRQTYVQHLNNILPEQARDDLFPAPSKKFQDADSEVSDGFL